MNDDRLNRFKEELEKLINTHGMESYCSTPDFVIAEYLIGCFLAYAEASKATRAWLGVDTAGL